MGPQSLPVEFNWPFGGWSGCSYPQGGTLLSACRRPAHFPRGERHDRFSGRLKPLGKVAPPSGGVLQTVEVLAVWGTEESPAASALGLRLQGLCGEFDLSGL